MGQAPATEVTVAFYTTVLWVYVWYFSAELEENTALNSKVWEAAGVNSNGTFPLDNFSYNNSALLDVIFRHLQKTNFSGITVSVGKEDGNDSYLHHQSDVLTMDPLLFLFCRVLFCLMTLVSGL